MRRGTEVKLTPTEWHLVEALVRGGSKSLTLAPETGSEDLRVAVRKGLAWFDTTQGPLGGYRYQRDDPRGDLSVTGWVAQAVEAARNEARSFLRRAVESLASLPDNTYRRSLQGICEFTVQRTH